MSTIAKKYQKLLGKMKAIDDAIEELRNECEHIEAIACFKSDTGNWCKADDSYWIEVDCPCCGMRYCFDSVNDKEQYDSWVSRVV